MRPHHLLAQMLHQPVEPPLGLGVDESVVGELADLTRRVHRELIQERLARPSVVAGLERQRDALSLDDLVEGFAHLIQRELGRVVSFRWLEFSLSTVEVDRTEVGAWAMQGRRLVGVTVVTALVVAVARVSVILVGNVVR